MAFSEVLNDNPKLFCDNALYGADGPDLEALQDKFKDHGQMNGMITTYHDDKKVFDTKKIELYGKSAVSEQLKEMVEKPNPSSNKKLICIRKASGGFLKKIRKQVSELDDYLQNNPQAAIYYGTQATPVYMALSLHQYDLARQLLEVGYGPDYAMPERKDILWEDEDDSCPEEDDGLGDIFASPEEDDGWRDIFASPDEEGLRYVCYNFITDFLLNCNDIPDELSELLWREIEKEYKQTQKIIPFAGAEYDNIICYNEYTNNKKSQEPHRTTPSDYPNKSVTYQDNLKKLAKTHPVLFEKMGEEGCIWCGDREQGLELQLFFSQQFQDSPHIMKQLLRMFSPWDHASSPWFNRVDDIWTDYDKHLEKLSVCYKRNKNLREYFFAWLLYGITVRTILKNDWLRKMAASFYDGMEFPEVLKILKEMNLSGYHSSDGVEYERWVLRNLLELAGSNYVYHIKNMKELDLLLRVIGFETEIFSYSLVDYKDWGMIVLGNIQGVQYKNKSLEQKAFEKLEKNIRETKDTELLYYMLEKGLLPADYIQEAINTANQANNTEILPVLLSWV
jgi:hypothetical protein